MKKKNKSTTIILLLILLAGLSLLLYPSASDYWNSLHQSKAIATYSDEVATLDEEQYTHLWEAAQNFNNIIKNRINFYLMDEFEKSEYNELLDVSGTGVMGYVEIPSINCSLPIYHGTDEAVLQIAVGHLEWSSLPVGGEGTHCVLSGHRGLPSAKLFTNLDKLVEGDVFILRVLDEVLSYQVDQILIVEPNVTDNLLIEEGKDYCTLVTCTPYGVNSHRLLVRGHRVENTAEATAAHVVADAIQIKPTIVASIIGILILFLLLIVMLIKPKRYY